MEFLEEWDQLVKAAQYGREVRLKTLATMPG